MKPFSNKSPFSAALQIFKRHNGVMRTNQALAAGIHSRVLYAMRDSGVIEAIDRGLYRLTDMPPLESPDLFTAASKVSQGVICLISALAFHDLTTQIPRSVSIALPKGAEQPRIAYPPMQFHRFSEPAFSEGIQAHKRDGVTLRVYSPEKTLADCFKFRKKIGIDICIEALRDWQKKKEADSNKLMYFAKICRIDKIIRPYVEALI